MPIVTVAIPAFKQQFLAATIASALQQTVTDIEILIGDDTPNRASEPIVAQFDDPRIKYFYNGPVSAYENSCALWEQATAPYWKWLFDDDILLPQSVEVLLDGLQRHPDAAMAFHERIIINEASEIIEAPTRLFADGEVTLLDRQYLVERMIARAENFIGEPSFTMFNRKHVRSISELVQRIDGYYAREIKFLGDVTQWLALADDHPIVGVGGIHGAFRRHAAQHSSGKSPRVSPGVYEWEMFVRAEAARGALRGDALHQAYRTLRRTYGSWWVQLPEIAEFAANLDGLLRDDPSTLATDPVFDAHAELGERAVTSRVHVAGLPQRTYFRCAVCESDVPSWLAAEGTSSAFLDTVGAIGPHTYTRVCPQCLSDEGERHTWLYLTDSGIVDALPGLRVLHVAPEPRLSQRLALAAGDGYSSVPGVEALDDLDGPFDLIVCNQVLQRVDLPAAVVSRLADLLKPGGRLVAQTAYSQILVNTLDTTVETPPVFAQFCFGSPEFRRLFGRDLIELMQNAALSGAPLMHTDVITTEDPATHGVDSREPFFLFTKA